MKRRNFLGLAGQSLALVAAAPALAPLATASPSMATIPGLGKAETARRIAKAKALAAGYGANPSMVMSVDGRRAIMNVAARTVNEVSEDCIYRQFNLSTPFDLSTAICEPDHTPGEDSCSET